MNSNNSKMSNFKLTPSNTISRSFLSQRDTFSAANHAPQQLPLSTATTVTTLSSSDSSQQSNPPITTFSDVSALI